MSTSTDASEIVSPPSTFLELTGRSALVGSAALLVAGAAAWVLRPGNVSNQQPLYRRSSEVLSLYHRIMRTAQSWPSIKKQEVIAGIRGEFRRNAGEEDAQKIEKMLAQARAGLKQLCHMAAEATRARAMPRARRAAWPPTAPGEQPDQWALDELGIANNNPTMADLKLAYHERAKVHHPDSGGSCADPEAFKRLTRAWEHLQKHHRHCVRTS